MTEHRGGDGQGSTNRFDGRADAVVQARDVYGDVHFAAPTGPDEPPRQVPAPSGHFTNQVTELARAMAALTHGGDLDGPKVVVLRGPPGIGKRELARQVATRLSDEYPDGHFYADLAGDTEASGVAGVESQRLKEFLIAVGYPVAGVPDSLAGRAALFRTWSVGKRVLVVLDNALTPAQVRSLMPGPGRSAVVATASGSLAGLSAHGSVAFVDLEPLPVASATQLLTRLVGADRAGSDPVAFGRLLEFCGGYPIALCVVGATLNAFPRRPFARVVRDLTDERTRLAGLSKDQNLSVNAVFSDAYQRLGDTAQACYRAIGRHPHTGELGAGVLVAAVGLPTLDVTDALDELLHVGLVQETEDERYRVHELMWLHARSVAARPEFASEADAVVLRMLAHYVDTALAAGRSVAPNRGWLDRLFPSASAADLPADTDAWAWLSAERVNLSAAVAWAAALGEHLSVCQVAVALWPFHEQAKYLDDELAVNELGVASARELGRPELESLLLSQQGFAHHHRGDSDKAYGTFADAQALARSCGSTEIEATALECMGLARIAQDRPDDARRLLRENLAIADRIGDPRRVALARFHLAKVEPPADALALLASAADLFAERAERYNLAKVATWRGRKLTEQGSLADAAAPLADALATMTDLGRPFDQAVALEALGDLAVANRDATGAVTSLREALVLYQQLGITAAAERVRASLGDVLGDEPVVLRAEGDLDPGGQ